MNFFNTKKWKKEMNGFPFVVPVVVFLLLFVTYPILVNFLLVFTDSNQHFIGLTNLINVFKDKLVIKSLINSIYFVACSVIGQLTLGTLVGILINHKFCDKGVVRSIIIIPWIMPGAVAAATWAWMYHSDFGIVKHLINSIGINMEQGPLVTASLVMPALILVNIWKMFPFVAVMILAGLQGIDKFLFEAADVDGSSIAQKLRYITLPQLKPILVTLLLLLTIWGANSMTIIFTMTGGGPANLSLILPIHIFQQIFTYYRINSASAESMVLFFILVLLIIMYMSTLSNDQRY